MLMSNALQRMQWEQADLTTSLHITMMQHDSLPNGKGSWQASKAGNKETHEGHDGVLQRCTQHHLAGLPQHIAEVLHCTQQTGVSMSYLYGCFGMLLNMCHND